MFDQLGDHLIELISGASLECVLAAPYVKHAALGRLLDVCADDVTVRVVTRWRLDELALGVSDIEIWPVLTDRPNTELWLSPSLHAKYYRADDRLLVGSANLTGAALGWSNRSNLEILVDASDLSALSGFEKSLFAASTRVDDQLYRRFAEALADLPRIGGDPVPDISLDGSVVSFREWRPNLRFPEDLYRYYTGDHDALTGAARDSAAVDIAALQPPQGLALEDFMRWIGLQLLQHPEYRAIEGFVTQSRRFGEMRALLASRGATDSGRAWQTWMRWLLHFLPQEFNFRTANYSEIVERTSRSAPPR